MNYKVLILFVDAPPSVREMLDRVLASEDYDGRWVASDRELVELLQSQRPDLMLLDFNRPLRRAVSILEQLQAVNTSSRSASLRSKDPGPSPIW